MGPTKTDKRLTDGRGKKIVFSGKGFPLKNVLIPRAVLGLASSFFGGRGSSTNLPNGKDLCREKEE